MASWTCTENMAMDAAVNDQPGHMERQASSSMVMAAATHRVTGRSGTHVPGVISDLDEDGGVRLRTLDPDRADIGKAFRERCGEGFQVRRHLAAARGTLALMPELLDCFRLLS